MAGIAPTDGDTSGGWARSPREVEDACAILGGQMQQIAARGARTVAQLSVGEHYALGVRAAAQWTTGRGAAPLSDEELPPDVESAVTVLALAEYLMGSDGTPGTVVALARGVRAWLRWLVGVQERMEFLALE